MIDKNKFKGVVISQGKNMHEVAEYIGINTSTLYRKLNGESDFFREEIQKICAFLSIENPIDIFFV